MRVLPFRSLVATDSRSTHALGRVYPRHSQKKFRRSAQAIKRSRLPLLMSPYRLHMVSLIARTYNGFARLLLLVIATFILSFLRGFWVPSVRSLFPKLDSFSLITIHAYSL